MAGPEDHILEDHMMSRCGILLPTALCFVAGVLPASAGADGRLYQHHGPHWNAVHRELENQIAAVEADPEIDPDNVSSSAVAKLRPSSYR
jgi:hypothetical protein